MNQHSPSTDSNPGTATRRTFLKQSSTAAALAGLSLSPLAAGVHAGESSTIRLAIVGCGGRGTGAVGNALSAPGGPVKLYAMADIAESQIARSHKSLSRKFADKLDVPPERQFVGFDAYRKAIDCLRPGDVVLLTTHAYCRPTHFDYAVEKGINVFMEKSFAPDPAGLKRMLSTGELADKKNLKVATGLMCRHSRARQALIEKVRAGALGDIHNIRAYRMASGRGLSPRKTESSEIMGQVRRPGPPHLIWVSSGRFIEWLIHQIDEVCWIKDAWPVTAHGMGGRAANNTCCGQNLDTYGIEYTFADGTKATVDYRTIKSCFNDFSTYINGAKCAAQFSGQTHRATVHIYKDQRVDRKNIVWTPEKDTTTAWQYEWNDLLDSIRKDRPHNETRRSILANFAGIMGRAAVHTGKIITWDQITGSDFQFCDNVDAVGPDSRPPVLPDAEGRYPVPVPGEWTEV